MTKLPCPREVFPLAAVAVAGFDSAIASMAALVVLTASDVGPGWAIVWLPLMIVILVLFTCGVSLLVAATTVYVQDVRHALPVLLQAGVFVTPVAFDLSDLSYRVRVLWAFVNPLTASIDGLRAIILTGSTPDAAVTAAGSAGALGVLFIGFLVFKRLEAGFADVV